MPHFPSLAWDLISEVSSRWQEEPPPHSQSRLSQRVGGVVQGQSSASAPQAGPGSPLETAKPNSEGLVTLQEPGSDGPLELTALGQSLGIWNLSTRDRGLSELGLRWAQNKPSLHCLDVPAWMPVALVSRPHPASSLPDIIPRDPGVTTGT